MHLPALSCGHGVGGGGTIEFPSDLLQGTSSDSLSLAVYIDELIRGESTPQ